MGQIDSGVQEVQSSTPNDGSVSIRRSFLETGRFIGERGGIGWSILSSVGVESPNKSEFKASDCLREDEIKLTEQLLDQGWEALWYGGDGYGKTTFMSELHKYFESKGLKVHFVLGVSGRNEESLKHIIGLIGEIKKENSEKRGEQIFLVDSVDYFWEDPAVGGYTGSTSRRRLRVELLEALHDSGCKIVYTCHEPEPKNKPIDLQLKVKCKRWLSKYDGVEEQHLSLIYPEEKVKSVLLRVGIPEPVVEYWLKHNNFSICKHVLLANYLLKGNLRDPKESGKYSLRRVLSFIESSLRIGNSMQDICQALSYAIKGRDSVRFQHWATTGF